MKMLQHDHNLSIFSDSPRQRAFAGPSHIAANSQRGRLRHLKLETL